MSRDCRRPSSVSRRSLGLLISAFLLGACGGTPDPGAKFTVGGTATGLLGTGLVLQNNAGDDLAVAGNGTFTFHTALASGAGYAVTIKAQPTFPAQTCAVTNATGTVGSGNVTDVAVTCTTNTYSVGGTVTGLTGQELVLQNNAGDDLTLAANGSFTFATRVASGSSYSVTVRAQPTSPRQTCVVANAIGTVASSNITDVAVTCTTKTYSVGGVVTGLAGSGLLLQNNFGDDLLISGNGTFTFATAMQAGSPYVLLPHNSHRHRGLKPRTSNGRRWALGGGLVTDGKQGSRTGAALA